jgi:formylglycine-generating enzyme required for sulfatase activity
MNEITAASYPFEPETIIIPAGEFLMGSDPEKDPHARGNEQPQHTLYLPRYATGKTPVTNAQYAAFLQATGYDPPPHWRFLFWKKRSPPRGKAEHPVVCVSWHDAVAYCQWLSEITSKPYHLPSEAQWEKASRGCDGRIYPWGDDWDPGRCNIGVVTGQENATPVDAYLSGASPYGLLDTVGNVWEWTRSLWGRKLPEPAFGYPYDAHDGRENLAASNSVRRVLRGVSFFNDVGAARCAYRYRYSPNNRYFSIGFRIALETDPVCL